MESASKTLRKSSSTPWLSRFSILEHSDTEERWVTIGRDSRGRVLVLTHTFQERPVKEWNVRIISARKATRREVKQYEGLRS
jgi:uncharacterized DUF497 family protein